LRDFNNGIQRYVIGLSEAYFAAAKKTALK
jgi:hypothetical protein